MTIVFFEQEILVCLLSLLLSGTDALQSSLPIVFVYAKVYYSVHTPAECKM